MAETWRPVTGYEAFYEVSDLGRVRSIRRTEMFRRKLNNGVVGEVTRTKGGSILAASRGSNGYYTVRLIGKTYTVHQLVLTAFVGQRPADHAACHGDGDKANNALSNLRWDTYAENNRERYKHGMAPIQKDAEGRFVKTRPEPASC